MGMVSGILPVVGVPLPFVSYGTAMVTLGLGLGFLTSISRNRRSVQTWESGRFWATPPPASANLPGSRIGMPSATTAQSGSSTARRGRANGHRVEHHEVGRDRRYQNFHGDGSGWHSTFAPILFRSQRALDC